MVIPRTCRRATRRTRRVEPQLGYKLGYRVRADTGIAHAIVGPARAPTLNSIPRPAPERAQPLPRTLYRGLAAGGSAAGGDCLWG
jgi:hypothetical protein